MFDHSLPSTFEPVPYEASGTLLRKSYFFHDIRLSCQTNHPAILTMLDKILARFPEPCIVRGEASYAVFCYESVSQFPVQLPQAHVRMETLRLLTRTRLKYYRGLDDVNEYQYYEALPAINAPALSVINPAERTAFVQIEGPDRYQASFLLRYVFLIALGQLVRQFDFEPCHSAAITAPWDDEQGALILGDSGSGKTTLSLSCACEGSGLLGDDLIMLREDAGIINAYSISADVSVRSGSIDLLPALSSLRAYPVDARDKRYCSIERIRTGATRARTPVRLLIFPSLATGGSSTLLPLSKAATLQTLIDYCSSAGNTYPQAQQRLFFLLSTLAEQARGYRLSVARGATDGPKLLHSLFTGADYD